MHPDFTYDPKSVVGVWADCLSGTFGIQASRWSSGTLAPAGLEVDKPLDLFRNADPKPSPPHLSLSDEDPACWSDWRPWSTPAGSR